ncbi:MAG: signal peptide peptidase SppA [Candidatus Cloacimonadota bacterium]|nr:signal peptide peptidase SppA [Candidatus Cloacimonadota bacterium]
MKKITVLFVIVLTTFSIVNANNFSTFSVANTDGIFATEINPAALGFGNAGGVGFVQFFSNEKIDKHQKFFLNLDNLGYCYQKYNDSYTHTLAVGQDVKGINLFFGSDYTWENDQFKNGSFKFSSLYRPWDFFSVGINGQKYFSDSRNGTLGFGLRPISIGNNFWDGLTISYDMSFDKKKWENKILGVEVKPVNGFAFKTTYNFEDKKYSASININFSHFQIGSSLFKTGEDYHGFIYTKISDKTFKNYFFKPKKNKIYDYKLDGIIADQLPSTKFGPIEIVSADGKTLEEILTTLTELKNNDEITGIVFQSGNIVTSMATFQEISTALLDFKSSGKKIIFYYKYASNMNYVLAASVADKIYLHPSGGIDLKGLSVSSPYIKDLLDTLGVDVINFRSHDFKTAGNMFSEDHMTEAERKVYECLLDNLYEEMISMISSGRNISQEKAEEWVNNGPYYVPQDAKTNGLVDGILYQDELEDKIKEDFGEVKIVEEHKQNYFRTDWSDNHQDKIAIIYASGFIHTGNGQPGRTIGSKSMAKAIKEARESKSIKGIILRVNSGGGSAIASDIIAHEMEKCREGENAKPVVVSMSGAAASGGYFISCYADSIIAEPSTITGSIGVIGIIPNFTRLYKKIHINWDYVKKGEHADIASTSRPMTEAEKNLIHKSIKHSYRDFIGCVAEGRGMDYDEINKIAQGRVWSGKSAKKIGLVDELGGLQTAKRAMKKLCKIDPEKEIELVKFPKSSPAMLKISFNSNLVSFTKTKLPDELNRVSNTIEQWNQFGDEKILFLCPYNFWEEQK